MKIKKFSDLKKGRKFLLIHSNCKVFRKVEEEGYNAIDLYTSYSEDRMKRHYIGPNALVMI